MSEIFVNNMGKEFQSNITGKQEHNSSHRQTVARSAAHFTYALLKND
jgi:hypothetical protein